MDEIKHLPVLHGPLRYLIGGNDTAVEAPGTTLELSYDAIRGKTRYGTLTSEKERFANLHAANLHGRFAPYLPANDITGDYGEWMPSPYHPGFIKNVQEQIDRALKYEAVRIELDNPDFDGLTVNAVLTAHDLAWKSGLRTIGKNPLLTADPVRYISHPSIDLVICERSNHGSADMEELRTALNQPLLAVRFVAFASDDEDGSSWAHAVAARIVKKGYKNMGVTFSPDGEYTSCRDILLPQ